MQEIRERIEDLINSLHDCESADEANNICDNLHIISLSFKKMGADLESDIDNDSYYIMVNTFEDLEGRALLGSKQAQSYADALPAECF